MRDLQECQAEVFRRSEKRIKERKKRRNHILMLCIPLVLCLTTIGGFFLSGGGPGKSADCAAPEMATGSLYAGSGENLPYGAFCGTVEVSGNGFSHLYTSVEDVQGIIDFIEEVISSPKTNTLSESIAVFDPQNGSTTLEDDSEIGGYKILIKHSNGTSTEYLLIGSTLTNQSTQESFPMTEGTYFALKDLLGIPFY